MPTRQVPRRIEERVDDAAAAAFHAAMVGAVIDYVTFDLAEGEGLPAGIEGRVKRHRDGGIDGFTVHDPTKNDLLALAGRKLVRAEIAIDHRPHRGITGLKRTCQLALIHRFIASRLWPFDGPGIYRAYRVAKETGQAYEPRVMNAEGDDLEWRLPAIHETLYLGDRHDYIRPGANAQTWAQVKLYVKITDQGQHLPDDQRRVRAEVTIATAGLRVLKIANTADLIGFNYRRQLSEYFRLLRPAPVVLLPHPNARRAARKQRRASPLVRGIQRRARELLCELALDGALQAGMISLIHNNRVALGVKHRDTKANDRMGTALDNLTKKLSLL